MEYLANMYLSLSVCLSADYYSGKWGLGECHTSSLCFLSRIDVLYRGLSVHSIGNIRRFHWTCTLFIGTKMWTFRLDRPMATRRHTADDALDVFSFPLFGFPFVSFYVGLCELISLASPASNRTQTQTQTQPKRMTSREIKTYLLLCHFYWFSVDIFIVRFKFNSNIRLVNIFVVSVMVYRLLAADCFGSCRCVHECIICVYF